MQNRKIWTIKECAAKYSRHGIKSILSNTNTQLITQFGKYELWQVNLDKKWHSDSILIIYRFLGKKLHISFSVPIDELICFLIKGKM